jgi:hypothetical protein
LGSQFRPCSLRRRQRRYSEKARRRWLRRQHRPRLSRRPGHPGCGAEGRDDRRRRPRCLSPGATAAGRTDVLAERGAHAAYRRPHARVAPGHAGLCDGESGGSFRGKAAAPHRQGCLRADLSINSHQNSETKLVRILLLASRGRRARYRPSDVLACAGASKLAFRIGE